MVVRFKLYRLPEEEVEYILGNITPLNRVLLKSFLKSMYSCEHSFEARMLLKSISWKDTYINKWTKHLVKIANTLITRAEDHGQVVLTPIETKGLVKIKSDLRRKLRTNS